MRRMVVDSVAMYDLAASKRILAQVLRAKFKQSLWHNIKHPVRPAEVATAPEVLLSRTAEPTPKAEQAKLLMQP